MKLRRPWILLIGGFGLAATLLALGVGKTQPQEVSPSADYYLNPLEHLLLTASAKAGNAESAFRLSAYHDFISGNENEADRWLEEAATMGHLGAEYSLGRRLIATGTSKADQERGWGLLRRAAKAGDPLASKYLSSHNPALAVEPNPTFNGRRGTLR
jgi:TPR repeat protein